MNYCKQSVKADSTKTTTTTTSSTIGEISATDEVELVEDFTNSPVLKYVNAEKPHLLERFVIIGDISQCFQCGRMED